MSAKKFFESDDNRLFQEMNKFRLANQLTDFTICVGEERIKAHKIIISANSDFFKAMLTNGIFEPEDAQVNLKDIDAEAVKIIVNFWYTNQMELTCENVCPILLAASRFQAQTALEVSTRLAEANLTAANCLGVAVLCERCYLAELGEKAFIMCLKHFEDIIQGTEILSVDEEFLRRIISDDRLDVSDESRVLELIIKWIEFDENLRSSRLEHLMGEVRFGLIDPISLFEITNHYKSQERYRESFIKVKECLLVKDQPDLVQKYGVDFKSNPRKPLSSSDLDQRLYIFGGSKQYRGNEYPSSTVDIYDPNTNKWSHYYGASSSGGYVGKNLAVAITKNCVYALSAEDDQKPQYHNLDTKQWSHGELLFHRPIGGFLIALAGCIYSFGKSHDDGDHVSSVIKYDLSKKVSTLCAPMQEPRVNPGFVAQNHYIYVMGGTKIGSEHAMKSVERYNSQEDRWEFVASMKMKRMSFSCCSCRGKIYVAGGVHCGEFTKRAEVYNPKLNIWTEIKQMNYSRADFGLVELLGKVYAVGGRDSYTTLDKVEAYDPESNTWSDKEEMADSKHSHCSLVL